MPIGPLPDGASRGMKFSSSRAKVGVVPPIGKASQHVDSTAVRSQQEWLSSAVRAQAEREEAPKYVASRRDSVDLASEVEE